MRPFLGITSVLCFVVAAITFLVASTIMGQTCALVLAAVGTMCGIGVTLLNAIEREGIETRRSLSRLAPPQ